MAKSKYFPSCSTNSFQSLSKYQLPLCRNLQADSEISMEMQGTQNNQPIQPSGKKEQIWRTHISPFQGLLQIYNNYKTWSSHIDMQFTGIELKSRNDHLWSTDFQQRTKAILQRNISLFNRCTGRTLCSHAKE